MKAGMSAIRPWLSCQYNKNTLTEVLTFDLETFVKEFFKLMIYSLVFNCTSSSRELI